MTRIRAFLIHLSISATIVGCICALIFFVWYPQPYFEVTGAGAVVRLLIIVDLIVGPLMTLILFRPGKPGLLFDISCVVTVQLAALIYGTQLIYFERPAYLVFAIDRFEVVSYSEIDAAAIPPEIQQNTPLVGPLFTVAKLPATEEEMQQLLTDVMAGKPDIERRPERWELYSRHARDVLGRARPLTEIAAERPDASERIDAFISARPGTGALLGIPIVGRNGAYCFVLDKETQQPVGVIAFDPWDVPVPVDEAGQSG